MNKDSVILDQCTGSAKHDNSAIRRVIDHIVANETIPATNADAVCPLLEDVDACGADVVVLDSDAGAGVAALGDVQARPAARIVRAHVLDELA